MSGMPRVTRRALLATAAAAGPMLAQTATSDKPVRIVCLYPLPPGEVQQVLEAVPPGRAEIKLVRNREEFQREAPTADVVFGEPRGSDMDYMPNVKWVQVMGAGVEWMDDALRNSKIQMTNMQRTFAPGISETAIGLLLCLTRRIGTDYVPQFLKREWKPLGRSWSNDYIELGGRTMGIVGMGGIGSAIARRAYYGFDMKIVATDAKPIPKPEYVSELHDPSWFMEMVPQVDVLVSAAPHTKKTERMFNEAVFKKMKKTAYFLAMSRGMLYDDMALAKACKEGWIAGAGLDVFPVEPPPKDHPIYDCKNVVMTPHTSGWGPEREVRLVGVLQENLRRYIAGAPLINVVDKQAGY